MSKKEDKLGRGEFIEFVKGLLLNSEQYKRDSESNSYVIALDSAWGTGKSYFIDLLMQSVTDDTLRIVKYNAWKNDYCENAFKPLIYDILTSDCLSFSMEKQADAKNVQEMISHIGKIGLAMGKQYFFHTVKNKLGIDFEESGMDFAKAFDEVKGTDNPFKNFLLMQSQELAEINNERESFEKFKQYLTKGMSYLKDNQKLVVIIDELDRCKPTFAIQTLEVVKHLFDIENVVFLFAVDIQQLSHSISSVYGQGFDSVGYLCRFFDYIAKMPEPNISIYIKNQIWSIEALAGKTDSSCRYSSVTVPLKFSLGIFFKEIYSVFGFSLRDLDTVIQSYKIMVDNFLFKYDETIAHEIYIFFLSLKYKYPRLYSMIFLSKDFDTKYKEEEVYQKLQGSFSNHPGIKSAMTYLEKKERLYQCEFEVIGRNDPPFEIYRRSDRFELEVFYHAQARRSNNRTTISFEGSNISNILFDADLLKWNRIRYMTYREYLHKQLEMYNFFNAETEDE